MAEDTGGSIPNTTSAGESDPDGPSGMQAPEPQSGSIPNTSSAGGDEGPGSDSDS